MRKLVYWCAPNLKDHPCYNLRARTRQDCEKLRLDYGEFNYGKPRKVVIMYENVFDLVQRVLGEGGVEPRGEG